MSYSLKSFGNSIISRQWEGLDPRISPIGLEFILKEGELFELLMERHKFWDYVNTYMTKGAEPYERPEDIKDREVVRDLIKKCRPKITIKIEMEGYAG